jgi:oligopeptide/dipeptide ABC transporter ATP-binding protein
MRQRVMIAMALCCRPDLLIADEPTTALDVTIQAQILQLMRDLQDRMHMGILFITHDLGVVAQIAEEVAVMYAGRIMETAPAADFFREPRHPYSRGLLRSVPGSLAGRKKADRPLETIPGGVPDLANLPDGCRFNERCGWAVDRCRAEPPPLLHISDPGRPDRSSACWRHGELAGNGEKGGR